MPVEGVNTAMTPAQFVAARTRSRPVEDAGRAATRPGSGGLTAAAADRPQPPTALAAARLVPPATFHFTYRPVPGKPAARRTPQVADAAYWSFSLNRVA
jgi:hypothetical protein